MATGDFGSIIDTEQVYAGKSATYPCMIPLHNLADKYVCVAAGGTATLLVYTFSVDSDGVITALDSLTISGYTYQGRVWICHANEDVYAIVADGGGNDGYILTVDIDSDGIITYKTFREFNEVYATDMHIAKVTDGMVLISCKGTIDLGEEEDPRYITRGLLYTYAIGSDGTIGVLNTDFAYIISNVELVFTPMAIPLGNNLWVILIYDSENDTVRAQTRTIDDDGTIGSIIDYDSFGLASSSGIESYRLTGTGVVIVGYSLSGAAAVSTFKVDGVGAIEYIATLNTGASCSYGRMSYINGMAIVCGEYGSSDLRAVSVSVSEDGKTLTHLDTFSTTSIYCYYGASSLSSYDFIIVAGEGSGCPVNTIGFTSGALVYPVSGLIRLTGITHIFDRRKKIYRQVNYYGGLANLPEGVLPYAVGNGPRTQTLTRPVTPKVKKLMDGE